MVQVVLADGDVGERWLRLFQDIAKLHNKSLSAWALEQLKVAALPHITPGSTIQSRDAVLEAERKRTP